MRRASRQFVDQTVPVVLARARLSDAPPGPGQRAEPVSAAGWIIGIVVLLAIAAVVLALVIPNMIAPREDRGSSGKGSLWPEDDLEAARVLTARQEVVALGQAVQLYILRVGALPEDLQDLMIGPLDFEGTWAPLVREIPQDPWGREYEFVIMDEEAREFIIRCFGRDGRPGGEPPYDADIIYPFGDDD